MMEKRRKITSNRVEMSQGIFVSGKKHVTQSSHCLKLRQKKEK